MLDLDKALIRKGILAVIENLDHDLYNGEYVEELSQEPEEVEHKISNLIAIFLEATHVSN